MSGAQSDGPTWHEELWAGTALFCCMYYIITINAKILGDIGIPQSAVIGATFLSIIIGNLSGALWTRTGLMIAPGIGISIFVSNFVQTFAIKSPDLFGWGDAMLACALAGAALVLTTWRTDLRSRVIEDMPDSVKRGAIAAIGSLLVYEAFKQFNALTSPQGVVNQLFGLLMIGAGVSFLVLFFLVRRVILPIGSSLRSDVLRFGLRIEFVLVIALSSVALHLFEPSYIQSLPARTELSWIWLAPGVWSSFHFGGAALCGWIILAAVVWFIVITDIPGTPNVVLPPTYQAANRERAVRGGYINDSLAALLSPILGTTPTIYYAENQISEGFECYSWRVGLTATTWFSMAFIIIGSSTWWGWSPISLERLLPPFAVLPAVFYIGLLIVSASFLGKAPQPDQPVKKRPIESYFPAAIAVLLTPRIGLEFAFPLTVISYWFVAGTRSGEGNPEHGRSFVWITWGAIVLLGIMFLIGVVFPRLGHT